MPKVKLHIQKIPLANGERVDRPPIFPRMPRLYLELIENKAKIRQNLVNKEYIPTVDETGGKYSKERDYYQDSSDEDSDVDVSKNFRDEDEDEDDGYKSVKKNIGRHSEMEINETGREKDSTDDDISLRLKSLIGEDDGQSVVSVASSNFGKYSVNRGRDGHSVSHPQEGKRPPTLAELQESGGYNPKPVFADINHVNHSQQEQDDLKRELMFKFELLKKSYPNSTVPEFTIHSDYEEMQKTYDQSVRRLSLDSTVDNYKTYLIGGFMACEFVFGNFLGFDMQGFTQQQITSMSSYEKLLIELGEKSYVPSGSQWPVELRLLFLIIMNAAFFVISKMIMKKTGANLLGMINSMNTTNTAPPPQSQSTSQTRTRKMRGPNIDFDNIPDI